MGILVKPNTLNIKITMKIKFLLYIIFVSSISACQFQPSKRQGGNLQDADASSTSLIKSKSYVLPKTLNEISGITFLNNSSQVVYAIQDEAGLIYTYDLSIEAITSQFEFGQDGDYEEITNDGKYFYVLKNNGDIFSIPVAMDVDQAKVSEFKGKLGKGEYESMGYDPENKNLVVLCKSCPTDKGNTTITGYVIHILEQGELSLMDQFSINLEEINQLLPKSLKSIKPSAISRGNADHSWHLLSSVDNVLITLDEQFKPKDLTLFSNKQFAQPEGIAFDSKGQMYISSEKGNAESGFIHQVNIRK